MNKFYVYQHINIINEKRYIGITSLLPQERWGTNDCKYKFSPYFWSAIQKYGWDNFKHEILFSSLTKEEACKKEQELISFYNTQDKAFGYNILNGGNHFSLPQEIKDIISKKLKGNTNGLGKVCSEEKKMKISLAQKGKHLTEEHKKKLSLAKKGKKRKPLSDEIKKKISDAHSKTRIYCLELNKVFDSIQSCAKELNLQATLICKCCKGKLKTTGGFHFQYYSNI